jgi:hypothetical protein
VMPAPDEGSNPAMVRHTGGVIGTWADARLRTSLRVVPSVYPTARESILSLPLLYRMQQHVL